LIEAAKFTDVRIDELPCFFGPASPSGVFGLMRKSMVRATYVRPRWGSGQAPQASCSPSRPSFVLRRPERARAQTLARRIVAMRIVDRCGTLRIKTEVRAEAAPAVRFI